MKSVLLVLSAAFALSANAGSKQIIIDGLKSQYKNQLSAEVSHTEYRQEQRQSTCSRQVPDGSHQECRYIPGNRECHETGGGRQCRYVGGGQTCGETPSGRQCHDLPGHEECYDTPGNRQCYDTPGYQDCYNVIDTRTEYYSCIETINVPYTVKDADIENEIVVDVEINRSLPSGIREVIDLVQNGKEFSLKSVQSTSKVLVIANSKQTEISNNGRLIRQQTQVSIKLLDRAAELGAFLSPVSEISFDANGLQLTTGLITDASLLKFDLEVKRNKLLGKDEMILQRTLTQSEVTFTNTGKQTLINVDFQKLGITEKIDGKKIKLAFQIQLNADLGHVVNRQDVPNNLVIRKESEKKL